MSDCDIYLMNRSALPEATSRIMQPDCDFIAPTTNELDEPAFECVHSAAEIAFDYGNTLISPTSYLFPPHEELFTVECDDESARPSITEPDEVTDRTLFGIRPCDVAAIKYMDTFFLDGEFTDSPYAARRNKTSLIALACDEAAHEYCFCSCCDAGPVAENGFDIQLSPLGEHFLVEVATTEAERIAKTWSDLLSPASESDVRQRNDAASELHTELSEHGNVPAAIRRVTGEVVPDEIWQEIGAKCIGCGSCSMVCPMCTCFYVSDERQDDGSTSRCRLWDSCQLSGFTLEASGVNPRSDPADRSYRWCYHKLSYRYVEMNEVPGCVGCGRCAIVCMGGVDTPQVLELIRSEP